MKTLFVDISRVSSVDKHWAQAPKAKGIKNELKTNYMKTLIVSVSSVDKANAVR
jgi:hypothetical protein